MTDQRDTQAGDPVKDTLVRYLNTARDTVLWKAEGLSDYDLRRPLTPTGTNLLGLLKHLVTVEAEYLGFVFGRPFPEPLAGYSEDDPVNADMYASASESTADIFGLARRVRAHADATIAASTLQSTGNVPWWSPEANPVTLSTILIHLVAEWNRHAGHIDILREEIDGVVGLRAGVTNLPPDGDIDWPAYVAMIQGLADPYR